MKDLEDTMNKLAWSLVLLMLGPPAGAQDRSATAADIRLIQAEADLLDESLRTLADDDPRAGELRRRERELRDDLERLAEQVRSNQMDGHGGLGTSKAEIETLRRDIVALRNDVEASGTSRERVGDISVPDGTEIEIRLDQSVSSRVARPEDRIKGSVAESVRVDGRLAIPAGSTIEGVVQSVEPARRPAHGGRLDLSFDSLALHNGPRMGMRARVVSVKEDSVDKSKAGLGALVGGVLGAIVEGKKGAVVGALVGGTGAVVATRGDDVELPAGTLLTLRLDRPFLVSRR